MCYGKQLNGVPGCRGAGVSTLTSPDRELVPCALTAFIR